MTGAQMVIQALRDNGVEHIFGYPGGAVLPIYDELFQQEEIQHILVRHEQGAGHAAEGYARSTGKPGVMLVTSGPGATNAVTPLQDALMDSIPLVCITGPGADNADRFRCVPGMRHGRHHPSVHQTQLAGQGSVGPAAHPARGVPRCDTAAVPVRSSSTSRRTCSSPPGTYHRRDRRCHVKSYQAAHGRATRPDPGGGRTDGARPSGQSSTPAAASSIPGRKPAGCCANWWN